MGRRIAKPRILAGDGQDVQVSAEARTAESGQTSPVCPASKFRCPPAEELSTPPIFSISNEKWISCAMLDRVGSGICLVADGLRSRFRGHSRRARKRTYECKRT